MFGLGRQLLSPRIQGVTVPTQLVRTSTAARPDSNLMVSSSRQGSENSSPVCLRSAVKNDLPRSSPKGSRSKIVQSIPAMSVEKVQGMVHPDLVPSEGLINIFNGEDHLVIPPVLKGCNVVILGCKSGLETYICSGLVGQSGRVIGIDSDNEEIEKAQKFLDHHMKLFNYKTPNTKFIRSALNDLSEIESESIDVVVSACSLGSQQEKERIFSECFRILKRGGEIYFSDVLSTRRQQIVDSNDAPMYTSIYKEDFRRLMNRAGFEDVRMVSREDITETLAQITNENKTCGRFYLMTVRAFKLFSFEDKKENYGQTATYLGTPMQSLQVPFCLDDDNTFYVGRSTKVDGNTAEILSQTRYKKLFDVTKRGSHEGLFLK